MTGYAIIDLGALMLALGCAAKWLYGRCRKFNVKVDGEFGDGVIFRTAGAGTPSCQQDMAARSEVSSPIGWVSGPSGDGPPSPS